MTSFARLVVVMLCTLVSSSALMGCAGTARDFARELMPGVVDGAIQGMTDPKNQDKIANNLQEGAVREGMRRLESGVVDGTLDMLDDAERKERLDVLASGLSAATQRMIQASVANALETALGEKTELRLRAILKGIITDVVVTLFTTIGAQMGTPEDRVEAIGKGAREITRQVTLGFQDAIDDTRLARERGELPDGRGSVLSAFSNLAKSGDTLVYGLGGALGLVFLLLIAMFVSFGRRYRMHKVEIQERDAALLLVADAIKSTEAEPWAGDLQRTLKEKLRDKAASDHLRKMLRTNQGLRFNPKTEPGAKAVLEP